MLRNEILKKELLNSLIQEGQSCGAFALTAVLASLGCIGVRGTELHRFAMDIYKKTGILNPEMGNGKGVTEPELIAHCHSAFNAPHQIICQALIYGKGPSLEVSVALDPGSEVVKGLLERYPNERKRTEKELQNGQAKKIEEVGFKKPVPGEVQIICVDNGEHWVAIDGENLYDPASGKVLPYTIGPGNQLSTGNDKVYAYSGIAIKISLKGEPGNFPDISANSPGH